MWTVVAAYALIIFGAGILVGVGLASLSISPPTSIGPDPLDHGPTE